MKNNKTYYQLNETDKFRAYVKPLSNGSYKYGIEKKITVFGINFWITIISYKSCTEPKFYIGCIPHPFKRIGEILNKIQCYN